MRPISEKQQEILRFIGAYTEEEGCPPSVREIAAAVGLRSPSSVHAHLKRLRERGYLEKKDRSTRAITLPPRPEAEDSPADSFTLRVCGDAMAGAGILDGDCITVHRQRNARQGQIVAVKLEGATACRRLHREDGALWLLPENEAYEPVPGGEAQILGVVVRVVRSYPL